MDGNGRWAQKRGLPRTAGHQQGVEACKRIVKDADELGVRYLTLFGFSTENWARPETEISELMRLLRMYLRAETAELHRNNVRLKMIGFRDQLAPDIIDLIENAEDLTRDNTGLTLVIALNYGGRSDIIQAAAQTAQNLQNQSKDLTFENFEEYIPHHFMTGDIPDPDILIRTSGESRISNFLLWQCAYAEFIFTQTLWPDFQKSDLQNAILEYQGRERRFGSIKSEVRS